MIFKSSDEGKTTNKKRPLRFGFGKMTYDYAETYKYLKFYLKFNDPVVIMHKSDFEDLLLNPDKFTDFKRNFYEMVYVLNAWGEYE